MTSLALPDTLIGRRQTSAEAVSRRTFLGMAGLLVIVAVASLANSSFEFGRPKFHEGSFTNGFSADFDVDRVDYKLAPGVTLSTTAGETYLTVKGLSHRITIAGHPLQNLFLIHATK